MARKNKSRVLFIVTGMSGAGKSQALKVLEDFGYFCVDNLPIGLLGAFVEFLDEKPQSRVALGLDIRGKGFVKGFTAALRALRREGYRPKIIFFDAKDKVLQQRFSETRRRHPLGRDIAESVREERRMLKPIRAAATRRIDTSRFSLRDLAERVAHEAGESVERKMALRFMSFGYKHGLPAEADIVMDVRFLPNPYWDLDLRPKTGLDRPVQTFLKKQKEVRFFLRRFEKMLKSLLPAYAREGKAYLTVAIGCTGGQHRSVFLSHDLSKRFKAKAFHRDVHR